ITSTMRTVPQSSVISIRNICSSAHTASRISFPGHHRPAETKERAYVRGTFFRYGGADEEGEVEEVEEAEEPTGEEVLEEAESTDEPLAVETEDDDDTEDEAEE